MTHTIVDLADAFNKLPTLLRHTLNRDVTCEKIAPFTIPDAQPSVTATYESNEGDVLAVCVCDLEFAANSGGALSMIPLGGVKESITAKKLDSSLADNFQEILNIFGSLFAAEGIPHVKLGRVYFSQRERPENVAKLISAPAARKDMKVSTSGYGAGRVSFFACARELKVGSPV
ncbi:MAG: hypothetical protein WCA92_00555 [Terriglobales bacterium]